MKDNEIQDPTPSAPSIGGSAPNVRREPDFEVGDIPTRVEPEGAAFEGDIAASAVVDSLNNIDESLVSEVERPEPVVIEPISAEVTDDQFKALQAELESVQASLESAKDAEVRANAEIQNVRRRAQKDVESAHKFGLEKFSKEMLSVLDTLERGLELIPEQDEAQAQAREGLSLTLKQLLEVCRKFSIEQVYPLGEAFNPDLHQAISTEESADTVPNSVVNVFQKGYTLSGRLLRPALVVVSKAPA